MIVGVIGGNLQGIEAAYLAKKAGWEVVVVDRRPQVPAAGLCDRFVQLDVLSEKQLGDALGGVDLIIPALEDTAALAGLNRWTRENNIPFAFDADAYDISVSKQRSNQMFARLGISIPRSDAGGGFPVVAKPNTSSGSQGVTIFHDLKALQQHLKSSNEQWVVQEFVTGPAYSLEVMGWSGLYIPLQVTDLEMDSRYDCKRVMAPTHLKPSHVYDFKEIATILADELNLNGLMDVEVILHQDTLKVLEIDARLPSQTPITVYWSTGMNIVKMLGNLFVNGILKKQPANDQKQGVVFEHIRVSANLLETGGEHILSGQDPLHIATGFFGANEAVTNYAPGRKEWVATLIMCGKNRQIAWNKRNAVIAKIRKRFNIEKYRDPVPSPFIRESCFDKA